MCSVCTVECSAYLTKSKVGDLDMSVLVQQQVLQLEVTIDDALGVQIPERRHDLRAVEARAVLAERALAGEVEEELAAVRVLHHETHAVGGLE